jgi:hypothetical protein
MLDQIAGPLVPVAFVIVLGAYWGREACIQCWSST